MYEIIVKTYVNDKRQKDMRFAKRYAKYGNAAKKAKELTRTQDGIEYKAYVIKELIPVPEDLAKKEYCNYRRIFVETEHGLDYLPDPGMYGSHAPASELFYRSLNHINGYWKEYDGNFYLEMY